LLRGRALQYRNLARLIALFDWSSAHFARVKGNVVRALQVGSVKVESRAIPSLFVATSQPNPCVFFEITIRSS
jgi:hypothetical protein